MDGMRVLSTPLYSPLGKTWEGGMSAFVPLEELVGAVFSEDFRETNFLLGNVPVSGVYSAIRECPPNHRQYLC